MKTLRKNRCYRLMHDYCLVIDRWPKTRLPIVWCNKLGLTTPDTVAVRRAKVAPRRRCGKVF